MRHRRWSADGTWERVLDELRRGCDEAEGSAWTLTEATSAALRLLCESWYYVSCRDVEELLVERVSNRPRHRLPMG